MRGAQMDQRAVASQRGKDRRDHPDQAQQPPDGELRQPDDELLLEESALEAFDPAWNLQERHAAIMRSLARLGVSVTGSNRFRRPALSIEDVDVLLERLMGRYGVISDYEVVTSEGWPRLVELKTREEEGVYERWELQVISVIRDTRPSGEREEERRTLFDVGSNPSAAISFALKRHKRELYHLGAVKEGVSDEGRERPGRGRSRRDLEAVACPLCGVVGALGWSERKQAYFCAAAKGGCGEDMADLANPDRQEIPVGRAQEYARLLELGLGVGAEGPGPFIGRARIDRKPGSELWFDVKLRAKLKKRTLRAPGARSRR